MNRIFIFASWNVCGLGDADKCIDVKSALSIYPPDIICIQESKLQSLNSFKASSVLPPSCRSFHFIPSIGASGGIITAWNEDLFECTTFSARSYSLTTSFKSRLSDYNFIITNVYGPCLADLKQDFLDELCLIGSTIAGPWLLFGDFNQILSPNERSNSNFNATEASRFQDSIDHLQLQEIPLLDRLFTWTNNQSIPILCRLDTAFVSTDWNFIFPNSTLSSRTRSVSDHVPICLPLPRSLVRRFSVSTTMSSL
jgi:exonuclease III